MPIWIKTLKIVGGAKQQLSSVAEPTHKIMRKTILLLVAALLPATTGLFANEQPKWVISTQLAEEIPFFTAPPAAIEAETPNIQSWLIAPQSAKEILPYVLYLHNTQTAKIHLLSLQGDTLFRSAAGILQPFAQRTIPIGLLIPSYGYSAQLPIEIPPQGAQLIIEHQNWLAEAMPSNIRLYTQAQWAKALQYHFNTFIAWQYLLIGALLMMIAYHLLAFFQHQDKSFLWYSAYISAVLLVILIESGILQAHITPQLPHLNLLHRYLQFHALLTYVIYWLFLRHLINLPSLLPWLDRYLVRFLAIVCLLSFISWVVFLQNLQQQKTNLTWLTYTVPAAALLFGVACFFPIIRARNKLVNFFVFGSLILLLGVITNTLLSAVITLGWLAELPFPPFYITEVAIVLEVLVFAMAVGFRFQQIDFERKSILELDQLKSKFFANISHEFRTPLTIISGLTAQIKGNREEVALIQRSSDNLLLLVNRLLQLTQLDSKQVQLQYVNMEVIAFLSYLTDSFYSLAEQKNIRLSFHSTEKELRMDFDEQSLQQIVGNLLSNAIKYTPTGGWVRLHLSLTYRSAKPYLAVEVKDNGIGIAPEELPYIFDRFYQSKVRNNHTPNSSGIGLALTKEWIELAKGEISVKSIPQQGSSFTVYLPIAARFPFQAMSTPDSVALTKNKQAFSSPATAPSLANNTLPELLIVEDQPGISKYLVKLLSNRYRITLAENGRIGLSLALQQVPDIILSDVMMPEMDGFELCRLLKTDERSSHIPIILLTAKANQADKITGLGQGADAYLLKPFDPEELFIRLEKLLELRRKLQTYYANLSIPAAERLPPNEVSSIEDQFLQRLRKNAERIMADPENAINQLEKAMHLSQMQLYRKLKALTGLSPSLYIRSIRLQKARELLQTTDLTAAEVAYEVGFTSPAYFSRVFAEAYGHPPGKSRT